LKIRLYNRGTTLGLQHLYKVTLETRPKLTALLQKISESRLNYFTTQTSAKCMCISIYMGGVGVALAVGVLL